MKMLVLKNSRVMFFFCILMLLAVLPTWNAEAQSADLLTKTVDCKELQQIMWSEMNQQTQLYAKQCDALEANQAWYEVYGNQN